MMYRYGNYEAHNYPIAVSLFKRCAIKKGEAEAQYQGGKYEYEVYRVGILQRYCRVVTKRWIEDNKKRRIKEMEELSNKAKKLFKSEMKKVRKKDV